MKDRSLFISCVSSQRPHPSGYLAKKYEQDGANVLNLFLNSRSIKLLAQDIFTLYLELKTGKYTKAIINVNGSVAQAFTVILCRLYCKQTTLWIMDSYPGCLGYVTKFWIFYYPFFYVAAIIAKALSQKVLLIDECFIFHAPTWIGYRRKCIYTPLPYHKSDDYMNPNLYQECNQNKPVIGIIGNIENEWLVNGFNTFYEEAWSKGFCIHFATSSPVDERIIKLKGVSSTIPWPKNKTNEVFSRCDAILVPLSTARLVYSSPSKIIDCYSRGIQPIVMANISDWNASRNRNIYRMCLHISEYFSGITPHSSLELKNYSKLWTAQ